jgi:hypothetical protein
MVEGANGQLHVKADDKRGTNAGKAETLQAKQLFLKRFAGMLSKSSSTAKCST